MAKYAKQLRRMVPKYAHQMYCNRAHRKVPPCIRIKDPETVTSTMVSASPTGSSSCQPEEQWRPRRMVGSATKAERQARARLLDAAATQVRPRLASYVILPRPDRPLAFPSALAKLELEIYRHQSENDILLPQLPMFSDYLASQAGSQYEALIARIRNLDR